MLILRNFSKLVVFSEDTLISAMNRNFKSAAFGADPEYIRSLLSNKVLALPLLDANQRLVAVALPRKASLEIEGRIIGDSAPAFLIAEIGNNHNGDLDRAIRLIDEAAAAGADCAKFQMRDLKTLYRNAGSIDDASADLGAQYTLDLLARFQLDDDDLFKAFDHCRAKGMIPLCTPWDLSSLEKLERYGLPAYKVASADFTNYELLEAIAATGKPMICSTGMSTEAEIRAGVAFLQKIGAPFSLLHCNSTYPAPFKDVNLLYIKHLKEVSEAVVGYSGHERGISVAIAAIAMGAKVIEKHFTLDKAMEGNDHKISLLPEEFRQMAEGIREVEEALGGQMERSLSQGELMNRETLAKSLIAVCDIPAGVAITEDMLAVRSPGHGLQPNRKAELIGRVLPIAKAAGDFFYPSDLGEGKVVARNYRFPYRWGVPVRYHDLQAMRTQSNMDLLEIHLSYKDMELDFKAFIPEPLDLGLVVHAPELFAGDHTLDLCAADPEYRERSIRELQRVIDLTRALAPYFTRTQRPCIVTNVGGFTHKGHLSADQLPELYTRLEESLAQLDMTGVEIIPQTMPPFPWHFGGQQFHNLFVDAASIVAFCRKNGMRVCLDVSHSKLACNHLKVSFADFLAQVSPLTAHFHIADAAGVDGEGLQIGAGDIDWAEFFRVVAAAQPVDATFIPEIWQGHKNGGEGAWLALERLERHAAAVN